jgi:LmbE family N-acetylglucosaminyl deacetylase
MNEESRPKKRGSGGKTNAKSGAARDVARRALVICAHDDDEVIGAGGTIRKLANAGTEVTTVVFATGNEGYQSLDAKDTIVAARAIERKRAQAILGTAHCIAHGRRDFENLEREDVYREIMRAVRMTRPHAVFSHLPTDYLAHRTLSRIVPEAVWQAGWRCSMELGEPWSVDRLYLFPILELAAKPSHVVDITDTIESKLEAMRAYASQQSVVAGILDQIEAKARAYGSLVGVKYGEAFMRSQAIPIKVEEPAEMLTQHLVV